MLHRSSINASYSSQQTQDLNSSLSSLSPRINLTTSRRSSLSSMDDTKHKVLTPQRSYPSLSSSLKSGKKKTSSRRRSIGSDLGFLTTAATRERSSKKMANDKRNREFHALFKSIPMDDHLIEDYGCALQKEILLQGRLYITQHHLCFNANIFGWVTNLVIAFTDILEIEKRTTAIFIPNAILISTHHSKHFFASFLSREQAHEQMVAIWRQTQQKISSITIDTSLQGSIDDSNSQYDDSDNGDDDDLSLTPWEDYDPDSSIMKKADDTNHIVALAPAIQFISDNNADRQLSLASLPIPAHANDEADAARRRAVSEAGPRPLTASIMQRSTAEPLPPRIRIKPETSSLGEGGALPAAIPTQQQQTQCQCANTSDDHYPHTVLDETYNCSLESLYNLLYHSGFIKKYLIQVEKSSDVVISPWRKGDDIPYVRDISYIKYLGGAIGPKSTKCIVKEELTHIDLNKSITHETTIQTPDVPSGRSFHVKTRVCISWTGLGQVRMLVTVFIAFSKSSWLKSTIEKACIDGQINYFKELNLAIRKYTEYRLGDGSRSKKNRHGKRKCHDLNGKSNSTISNATTITCSSSSSLPASIFHNFINGLAQRTGDFFQLNGDKGKMRRPIVTWAQCTMICLSLMVVTNLYIAYKMINMGQQLYSMHMDNHHSVVPSTSSPLYLNSSPLDMWRQEHQQDVTSMWQWLNQLEKDPWVTTQYYAQQQQQQHRYQWRKQHEHQKYNTNTDRTTPDNKLHHQHHLSPTQRRPKHMNTHITEIEKMVHHTEQGVDQVNHMVKQHRDSLLQNYSS